MFVEEYELLLLVNILFTLIKIDIFVRTGKKGQVTTLSSRVCMRFFIKYCLILLLK